jgi:flagellar hook-length control protein FliK
LISKKKQAEHDDESWQVQLCLDTQNLGAVQASVTLHGEDVKVVIRAERAESAQLLEENLPLLNATLAKLNVSISHMSCVCDEVKHHFANNHGPAESTSLVDISV